MSAELPTVALSINQPWAWLIAARQKDLENRNWKTDFRGEFLIHAGKKVDRDCLDDVFTGVHPLTGHPMPPDFDRSPTLHTGGMVGIAEVYDCVSLNSGGRENPWFVGKYGFLVRNARPIELIPCVGALGFFRPNYELQYAPPKVKNPRPVKTAMVAEAVAKQAGLFQEPADVG